MNWGFLNAFRDWVSTPEGKVALITIVLTAVLTAIAMTIIPPIVRFLWRIPTYIRRGCAMLKTEVSKFCNWLKWRRYGPIFSIGEPVIDTKPINAKGSVPQYYGSQFSIIVHKNRGDSPVQIYVNSVRMLLKQKLGLDSRFMSFHISNTQERIVIPPHNEHDVVVPITMLGYPSGTITPYLDLTKKYHWKIEGIQFELGGIPPRLHSKEGWTNIEEAKYQ